VISVKRGRGNGREDGGKQIECVWRLHLQPALGKRRLTHTTRTFVADKLSVISAAGKTPTALHAFRLLMQMLRWAENRNPYRRMLIDSDLLGMEENEVIVGHYDSEEHEGSRVLDDNELRQLASGLQRSTMPPASKLLLLIMTATLKRIREMCLGEWAHVNFESAEWKIPKEHSKNGRDTIVYLSPFALSLFHRLRAISTGRFMFPVRRHLNKPVRAISPTSIATRIRHRQIDEVGYNLAAADRRVLALEHGYWTSHDLRRTGATTMQRLGVGEAIVHRCLAHTSKVAGAGKIDVDSIKLGRIYLRFEYEAEMRDAWNRLGAHLEQIMVVDDTMPILLAA
jgi:integrase